MGIGVGAKALQRGVQPTEVEALAAVGQPEVLLERLALGRVFALLAEPVLHQPFAGELQQRRPVTGQVKHREVAGRRFEVEQVGGRVAVDVQGAHAKGTGGWLQPRRLPDQRLRCLAQAALTDLLVAGGDEVQLAGQAVAWQMLTPVAVQLLLEGVWKSSASMKA